MAEKPRRRTVSPGAELSLTPSTQKGIRVKSQPQERRAVDARTVKKIELYVFLGLLVLAIAVVVVLSLNGTPIGAAIQIMAWIYVPIAVAVNFWLRRKKGLAMSEAPPVSLDDVRARIDADTVRSLKASKGEASAVKELRRQEPQLGLAQALELVRQL